MTKLIKHLKNLKSSIDDVRYKWTKPMIRTTDQLIPQIIETLEDNKDHIKYLKNANKLLNKTISELRIKIENQEHEIKSQKEFIDVITGYEVIDKN